MLGSNIIVKVLKNGTYEHITVRSSQTTQAEINELTVNLSAYAIVDIKKITVKINGVNTINFTYNIESKLLTITQLTPETEYNIEILFPCYQTGSVIMKGHSLNISSEYETVDTTIFGDDFTREELTIKKTSFTFEAYEENAIVKQLWDLKKPVIVEIYEDEEISDIVKGYLKKIEKKINVKDTTKITYEFTSSN